MIDLVRIWGIFATIFLALGIYHWAVRAESIAHFKVRGRPFSQSGSIKALGSDFDQPIKEFADDFNKYLDDYNKKSREQHMFQAIGYWAASGTAIASMIRIAI